MAAESRLDGWVLPLFSAAPGGPGLQRNRAAMSSGLLKNDAYRSLEERFGLLKDTGDEIAGPTGFPLFRPAFSCVSVARRAMEDSVEDAAFTRAGDKIAGATGKAEALTPHLRVGNRLRPDSTSCSFVPEQRKTSA
jgi:hypothetical protein